MNGGIDPQAAEKARKRIVCDGCAGDRYLAAEIVRLGVKGQCSYCEKESNAIEVEDFVKYIKRFFDDHVEEVVNGEKGKKQRSFIEIIEDNTKLNPKAVNDVKMVFEDIISKNHGDEFESKKGYNKNSRYVYKSLEEVVTDDSWNNLQKCIKEENRLFNSEARGILDEMLHESLDLAISREHSEIVRVVSEDSKQSLFRARVFRSDRGLAKAFKRPVQEFGPPPSSLAPDGRMNSRGISVFYGASTRECAIREVRPPVGSLVLVACFDFARELRLLDATRLEDIILQVSIFDPLFLDLSRKSRFILSLSNQVSAPVMRADEPLDYLITQAVSDYLSEMPEPKLDGIIYRSTQKEDSKEENVVLFHKSSRAEIREDQVNMRIKSGFDHEGRVTFSVVNAASNKKAENAREADASASDRRNVALRLDMLNFSVHRITGVLYEDDERIIDQSQEGHLVGVESEGHA